MVGELEKSLERSERRLPWRPKSCCLRPERASGWYSIEGYLQKNEYNAYSLNNVTAKKGVDGSVAVQFSGCDGKIQNCLPAMQGWNYTVRLYRPRAEFLNGTWKFPEAQLVTTPHG